MHDVAGAKAGGEQRPRRTPEIHAGAFGLEDRTGRHQQPPHPAGRTDIESAEWRMLLLPGGELGLAQHRKPRQRCA